jgi:hypothetical protein
MLKELEGRTSGSGFRNVGASVQKVPDLEDGDFLT